MKKFSCVLMAAVIAAGSVVPAFAATGVTNGTMKIGGSTASISTINMSGNRTFEIMVANQTLDTHQSGKSMISNTNQKEGEVVAAVNGGFFSLSDWSVCNTMVQDGRLIAGSGWSNAVGITYDGQILIDSVKLSGKATITKSGKEPYTVSSWIINRADDASGAWIAFLNEYCRENVSVPSGGIAFFVENGKVTGTMRSGIINPMSHQDVILYNSVAVKQAEQYGTLPSVGDAVAFGISAEPTKANTKEQWENAKAVMGGAVMLVSNGQNVAYTNSYTAADQKPNSVRQRVFVAKMASGQFVMGTVYSSYVKIAEALIAAGAVDAMAMDGGSSSMLYSNGKYLKSAGRELTMGLAVVDESSVSKIPNVAGSFIPSVSTEVSNTVEAPEEILNAEEDDTSDIESFFEMVNQAFNKGAASNTNSGIVSANPEMRPNTSVSFATEENTTSNTTQPAGQTGGLQMLPPTSVSGSTSQDGVEIQPQSNQNNVSAGQNNTSGSNAQSNTTVTQNPNTYLTQREFGLLLVDVMEKKHAGVLMNSVEANDLAAGSKEDALSKLGVFTANDPAAPITRAQAAVALMRAHQLITNRNSSTFYSLKDCSNLSEETIFAINYVVGNGLMSASNSMFNPNAAFTAGDGNLVRNAF